MRHAITASTRTVVKQHCQVVCKQRRIAHQAPVGEPSRSLVADVPIRTSSLVIVVVFKRATETLIAG